jgi:S-adenosylmethionine hydrolase
MISVALSSYWSRTLEAKNDHKPRMSPRGLLPITFMTDYGHEDELVGVCHGVIQRIAPGTLVIDVAHGLPPHGVRTAAIALRNALPFMPTGVHLAVVDPGVGTERRPVALRCPDGNFLVGPDNGLLWLATERLGSAEQVVDLTDSPCWLETASATFNGRDLFAPVAARLSQGARLEVVGDNVPPESLVTFQLPLPSTASGELRTHALGIDRFGNVQLGAGRHHMSEAGLEPGATVVIEAAGKRHEAVYTGAFGGVGKGDLLLYMDSSDAIAIAVNRGDAAARTGIELDALVRLLAT